MNPNENNKFIPNNSSSNTQTFNTVNNIPNNQMGGMPNNQPIMPNSNPTNPSMGSVPNKPKNNQIFIIIGVIVAVIICLFLGFKLLGGSSTTGGKKTSNMNEKLLVKNEYNNFSIEVENIEENYKKNSSDDESYVRMKVKINNNSNDELSLNYYLSLVDDNDKEVSFIDDFSIVLSDIDDNLELSIPAKQTKEGYIYFNQPETSFSKLRITVIKSMEVDSDGVIKGENDYYYVKLK